MKTVIILLLATITSYPCFSQIKDSLHKARDTNVQQAALTDSAGKIGMSGSLQSATIIGSRPLIRQEVDRISYDLQADPQSKVNTLLDMMRKVPYLSVDADDNILLKGSKGYRIFINGKPSAIVERNPKDVLRSIPASTIKHIEVITTPPSKYDAEGLAGIINIITIKEVVNGYHGSMNISEKRPVGGPGGGGSLSFKKGKFGVSGMTGIRRYDIPETAGDQKRTTTGTIPTILQQHATKKSRSHTIYSGLEVSHEIDSLNLVSGQANWYRSKSTGLSTQRSTLTGTGLYQHYQLDNNNSSRDWGVDASINYQRGFSANKDQLLTFSYQYLKESVSVYNDIMFSDEINHTVPDYRQNNSEELGEHTAQIDYVQPIKSLIIEGGIKGIFRTNGSHFQYRALNTSSGEYDTDPKRSNIFINSPDILSVYNSYSYHSGDWQLKAGVRAEQTLIKGHSQSIAPIERHYLNLLPAIVVNRKFKDGSSLNLSFTKRIQRPSTAELNPFIDRSNPNFVSSGNPHLQPIKSDVYEVSYLKSAKATINISMGGMFFKHVFNAIASYDPIVHITTSRLENYGKGRVIKTNLYLRYPIMGKWEFSFNSDIRYVLVYGFTNNNPIKSSGLDVYMYASGAYHFNNGWRANADITYKKGGLLLPMGRTNGFIASSFSVSKDMVQKKLTLSAAVNNPFTKYRYIDESITGFDFLQTSHNQVYHRRFTLSINYKFGKLDEGIKKSKRGIINDDVSLK